MRIGVFLTLLALVVILAWPVEAAQVAQGQPNEQHVYSSGQFDVRPDQGADAGCVTLRDVSVTVNTTSGSVNVAVGQALDVGSSSDSASSTTTTYANHDDEVGTPVTVTDPPGPTGVNVDEPAGAAVGICGKIDEGGDTYGPQGPPNPAEISNVSCYTLKFQVDDCPYTIQVCVSFPRTGATPTVTVSDGS